ncbi:hypothetical protein GLOIN_2v1881393 [Rhizophagus irregularis DAOM 181602=DAOM 197198]|nr:hypothetical protein GLOIN_2v1881393 [Rhizophagus irregularis DAOM 181602=DAOM 197198]
MESAYKFTEYRYRFLKETKNFSSADSRTMVKGQERARRDSSLSKTEQNFLESIRNDAVRRKETIQEIVLKCSATSFDVYIDKIKRLSWENSKLREELRQKDHMMDKKGKLEKTQERIISQKNEQIRKISQEVEKTRSEVKKVKTDINKEFDQLKKSKKGRSTSNRRKREEILEIPVLPENTSNYQQFKEARDIFFYDIPKYWSEDDVRTNLMKIGTVYRLQIRGQYKYKTVKAKITLNENFEKTFLDGHFGICISKNFIRWYNAKLGLKGRQERDQWQTVRDLTNEEMESIKKGNTYDFTKKLQQTSKTAFIKIIKITKNWKVIGYFKNLKAMEEAVEDSCTQGDINRVWLVIDTENRTRSPIRLASEPKSPITPPERIYRELGNFASRKESLLHPSKADNPLRISKTPDKNEVVEMIKNWRNQIRSVSRINQRWKFGRQIEGSERYLQSNVQCNGMGKINVEAVDELRKEHGIKNWDEAKNWALEKNNFFRLGQKIISLAEKSKIFEEYTTLNDNFKQRLENENHYQDEKKTGEKRPILESPSKWSDIEDEEERNKAFKAFYLEKRQREQLIPSPSTNEDKEGDEEEEEEEEELETKASPSKKNSIRGIWWNIMFGCETVGTHLLEAA